MKRTKFYNTTTVNGKKEVDMLWNTLSSFTLKYDPIYYRISSHDISQPDLISKKMYNTERYWWIILVVNGIMNPLLDIVEGSIIKIPNILDIYEFYKTYKVR
jgi:hypothetical protein